MLHAAKAGSHESVRADASPRRIERGVIVNVADDGIEWLDHGERGARLDLGAELVRIARQGLVWDLQVAHFERDSDWCPYRVLLLLLLLHLL